MLSIKTCAAAILFAAVGMCSASAETVNLNYSLDNSFLTSFYTADLGFSLPSGFTNAKLTITTFNADDRAILQLNGTTVGNTGIFGAGPGSFVFTGGGANDPFLFTSGNGLPHDDVTSGFLVGQNTLSFIINDTGTGISGSLTSSTGPTEIEFDAILTYSVTSAVPEPSTWAMMLLGFAGIGYGVYRSKKAAPALAA
ncbi:PEPxxWA-CTERM sorting domain-containing protein [Bradyrhizobium algeriense]|uniref:PEPxxWA-CTERM sorting domain-containing protein n=1 Tax=Bradyrhizobium algeriense TaxID=634784 RepID=UPI000D392F85|nr:PEPxxWA-CTERM sorting domain-containing protein [Bradyrhizobium algeriense]